ncbi:MAG: hypothetical protein GXY54_11975 [Deltaproteobacteria bacterium]|nr:hypothetical protein [Deltaproteobacteria bacterium]
MTSAAIVQKLWNFCNVLRDDGMSYLSAFDHAQASLSAYWNAQASGDYVEQRTYQKLSKIQLLLKMQQLR